MIEALVTVVFISVFMLLILQICQITINDMSANEAAFISMRSAAVTESKERNKEIKERAENYFLFLNPIGYALKKGIVLIDKERAETFLQRQGQENPQDESISGGNEGSKSVTIWDGKETAVDFSGKHLKRQTVKIYYYTGIIFGSFFANSYRGKRYQSARSRMFPSPDEKFYYKTHPNAKNFDEENGGEQ